MDLYDEYRFVFNKGGSNFAYFAQVQMREVFSGPDIIGGGVASASGVIDSGSADSPIDGDLATFIQYRVGARTGYWNYVFPTPVAVREYALVSAGTLEKWSFQARKTGGGWITLDSRSGQSMPAGVAYSFSLYELAGTAKFSDGAVAVGGFVNRTDTGEKFGDIFPDINGDFSVLTQDAGPFDLLIYRSGYRPLVLDSQLASEA